MLYTESSKLSNENRNIMPCYIKQHKWHELGKPNVTTKARDETFRARRNPRRREDSAAFKASDTAL